MKFYINFTTEKKALPTKGKAKFLIENEKDVIPIHNDFKYENIPNNKALIVVVDYNAFDVAYLVKKKDFEDLQLEERNYRLLLMDQERALSISGIKKYLDL